jgi:putative membrane protein
MKKIMLAMITLTMTMTAFAMQLPKDAEVATEMVTINNGEIKVSKLAEERATNPKVKEFATMMVKDHEANRAATLALSRKINLGEKQTDASYKMKEQNRMEIHKLSKLHGKAFDKAYMEAMVENHTQAYRKLDQSLVPYAVNPELKAMLTDTQKKVNEHLEHAKEIKNSL